MRCHFRRSGRVLAVLTFAALLAGCSTGSGYGPVPYRDGAAGERGLSSGTYTVQRGDTIYSIARQYNLSVRALIDGNRLQPPFQLTVGQVLALPGGADYVVVKGDTLNGVARKTGVPFTTLAGLNSLSAPYVLRVGQRLKLPGGGEPGDMSTGPQVVESPAGQPSPAPAVATAPMAAPAAAAAAPEERPETSTLARTNVAAAPAPIAPPPSSSSGGQGGYATLAQREAAAAPAPAAAAVPAAEPPPAAEQKTAMASPPPAAGMAKPGKGFIWPVQGELIGEFGTTGKGQHNDGINIAVPRGTPVVAAQDGVVAYAGNELRGFGNLLLIKHADGWMTAYAHNDELLVKRGEAVKRGQRIAKAGDSGGVGQTQLHFEVRQGTHAIDPMTVLAGKTTPASADGNPG